MTAPTETWYLRTLADDLLDTVQKGYEIDPSHVVSSLRTAADQIDALTVDRDRAKARVTVAPHAEDCESVLSGLVGGGVFVKCNCWKEEATA